MSGRDFQSIILNRFETHRQATVSIHHFGIDSRALEYGEDIVAEFAVWE